MSSDKATKAYVELEQRFHQMAALGHAGSILSKDRETAMPRGGAASRIEQQIALGKAVHDIISNPEMEELLCEAETGRESLPPKLRKNLELMRNSWIHEASLPSDLAEAASLASAEGEEMHDAHYKSGDWSKMEAVYKKSFDIARECGQIIMEKIGAASPYEANIDKYSRGMKVERIQKEYAPLRDKLPGMIQQAVELQKSAPAPKPLTGEFSVERQMILNRQILKAMGFDFNRGKIDAIIGHPSSGGAPNDIRLSSRCEKSTFIPSSYAAIHEGGHGLYDLNTPEDIDETTKRPIYRMVNGSMGMDVHESQSLIMEVQAGMSTEFIVGYLSQQAQKVFNAPPRLEEMPEIGTARWLKECALWIARTSTMNDRGLSSENLLRTIQRVEPSFIRVDADEMTYPMHVMLRFELEQEIMDRRLDVSDLPAAWNEKMKNYLGITPPGNHQGCMQDVHWPAGLIGYFPFYSRGAMIAAQFAAAARHEHPDLDKDLGRGDFSKLLGWLNENVHSKGSLLDTDDLIVQATGETLNPEHFLAHLNKRYLKMDPKI